MQLTHSIKNILVSLIESIDVYNYLLKHHHRRTSIIAYQLGKQFGLSSKQLSNLVLASSIHDIGALYVEERDKLLYIDTVDHEHHEILGEKILKDFKPFEYISKIIRHHHIRYDDIVNGVVDLKDVPIECFFLHLADRIDVLLITHPDDDNIKQYVTKEINKRFGTVFMPELKETFNTLVVDSEFWNKIDDLSYNNLLLMSAEDESCAIDDCAIESFAEMFAQVVDFKSPWTKNHSKSVSALAENIGKIYGLSPEKCFNLKIAGYLHDIGKIAIPVEILDKEDKLDDNEYEVMKTHAMFSSIILTKASVLGEIAQWASRHHEKRDKSGYPLGMGGADFTTEMDILAFADVFAALDENRPYRSALPKEEIIDVLRKLSPNKLDKAVFDVIEDNFDYLYEINTKVIKQCENEMRISY